MKKLILLEAIYIFFLGVLPTIISYLFGGVELLTKVVNSLLWNTFVFSYALTLTFTYIISTVIRKTFLWLNTNQVSALFVEVLEELGQSSINLLRIATGVLIVIPILVYFNEPTQINEKLVKLLFYGFIGFVEICCLSSLHVSFKKKWR